MTSLSDHLWINGAGHLWGAKALLEYSENFAAEHDDIDDNEQFVFNGRYSQSLHFLIGFASELLLKSALAAAGADESKLRELGHDLEKIMQAADEAGVEIVDQELRKIFELHGAAHVRLEFRYGKEREIPLPEPDKAIELIEAYAVAIQEGLGIAAE